MSRAVVGLDLGTSSVKVIAVDDDGRVIAQATRSYPLVHPEPGAAEQDPDVWWEAVCASLQEITAIVPDVAAVGLTGQMHGAVFLGQDARPIRPAIIWADTRSGVQAKAVEAEIGRDRLATTTGTAIAAGFQAASIRWLQATDPGTWGRVATVLLPKDEIRRRLTGELATDPSDAAGTGMLDLETRSWSSAMLGAVGIERRRLPIIKRSAGRAGAITEAASRATGLREGTPVVGGAGDAAAGAIAAGVVDEGDRLLSLSSGAQVIAPMRRPLVDADLRIHSFASALDPDAGEPGWSAMGATMSAGSAIRWLRDEVFRLSGATAFADMERAASLAPAGAGGLLFLPYLAGERTPHLDPDARGVFLGLSAEHGRGHLVRSVMEGSIFALLDASNVVRELVPDPPRKVVLAGGGSRSPLWRQIVADVFGIPIAPLTVGEQSAMGGAMLASAIVRGVPVSDIARSWVRIDDPVQPIPDNMTKYRELFAIYRELYPLHREHFQRLKALRK